MCIRDSNSIASGIFTMISVGIMRGVYPNVLRAWRDGGQAAAKPLLDQGVRLYLLIAVDVYKRQDALDGINVLSRFMNHFHNYNASLFSILIQEYIVP